MDDIEMRVERVFRVSDTPAFWVVNYRGQVSITGWDQPEIRVVAQKRGEDAFGRPDGRWVRGLKAEQSGALISLQTQAAPLAAAASGTVPRAMDIDIRAPRQVVAMVESPNGLVVAGDMSGIIFVRTDTGHVSLRRMAGQFLVLGESGSCTGDWLRGEMAFRLGGGSLQLRESVLTWLDGETSSGDIEVQALLSPGTQDGVYAMRSRSGSITLEMAPAGDLTLDLHSDTGQADFSASGEVLVSNPGERVVRVGRGTTPVHLHTAHGNVHVRPWRWEGEPPAPRLPSGGFFPDLPASAPEEIQLLREVAEKRVSAAEALHRLAARPAAW